MSEQNGTQEPQEAQVDEEAHHLPDTKLGMLLICFGGRRTAAWAKSNVISWGGFGLVFGALAGALGGGGILGLLGGGLLTGVVWGLCGLVAGVLYGRWAGTAISARRLRRLGSLLPPGTSTLLAWAEGPPSHDMLDMLTTPDAQRLVLRFNSIPGGAVLEAA